MMKGLAAVVLLLAGCDLYFGGGGGDDVCNGTGGGVRPSPPAQEVRDPNTGVCQYSGGGGGGCDECGNCYAEPAIALDWGACYGACSDLAENTCMATSGCYAAYIDDPAADGLPQFWGCWNVAPSGPVQGACDNLDAYSCSRHDNCIAVYSGKSDATNTAYEGTTFERCAIEQTAAYCTDNTQCGEHEFCDTSTCYPSPTCPNCPTCGACPDSNVCYGVCQQVSDVPCEALYVENACIARTDCSPLYEGSDCTCDMTGCHCQVLTFVGCEPL